jgi:tight adherence protein B
VELMSEGHGPTLLLIILAGGLSGLGWALLADALTPRERPQEQNSTQALLDFARGRGAAAAAVGLITLVVTWWPVAALGATALALMGPSLVGGARAEKLAAARIEALALWTESLRDTIAGAVGLEQAIMSTAQNAPPAVAEELANLSDRLRMRVNLSTALHQFAEDLDDPSADLIVAALILNAKLRGPGLRQVLSSLADAARAELDMRGRITAGRSSTRHSVQIVIGITALFVVGLVLLSPDYVEPYRSFTGQIVMVVVLGLFAVGLWWLRKLSSFELPERFLTTTDTGTGALR